MAGKGLAQGFSRLGRRNDMATGLAWRRENGGMQAGSRGVDSATTAIPEPSQCHPKAIPELSQGAKCGVRKQRGSRQGGWPGGVYALVFHDGH